MRQEIRYQYKKSWQRDDNNRCRPTRECETAVVYSVTPIKHKHKENIIQDTRETFSEIGASRRRAKRSHKREIGMEVEQVEVSKKTPKREDNKDKEICGGLLAHRAARVCPQEAAFVELNVLAEPFVPHKMKEEVETINDETEDLFYDCKEIHAETANVKQGVSQTDTTENDSGSQYSVLDKQIIDNVQKKDMQTENHSENSSSVFDKEIMNIEQEIHMPTDIVNHTSISVLAAECEITAELSSQKKRQDIIDQDSDKLEVKPNRLPKTIDEIGKLADVVTSERQPGVTGNSSGFHPASSSGYRSADVRLSKRNEYFSMNYDVRCSDYSSRNGDYTNRFNYASSSGYRSADMHLSERDESFSKNSHVGCSCCSIGSRDSFACASYDKDCDDFDCNEDSNLLHLDVYSDLENNIKERVQNLIGSPQSTLDIKFQFQLQKMMWNVNKKLLVRVEDHLRYLNTVEALTTTFKKSFCEAEDKIKFLKID